MGRRISADGEAGVRWPLDPANIPPEPPPPPRTLRPGSPRLIGAGLGVVWGLVAGVLVARVFASGQNPPFEFDLAVVSCPAGALAGFGVGNLVLRRPRLGAIQMVLVGQALGAALFTAQQGLDLLIVFPPALVIAAGLVPITAAASLAWVGSFRVLSMWISPEVRDTASRGGRHDGLTVWLTLILSGAAFAVGLCEIALLGSGMGPGL